MKNLILVSILLLSSSSFARTVLLQPGEQVRSGYDTIICGGEVNEKPDVKWMCACFAGNDNKGMVYGLWAPDDLQTAERFAIERCRREKRERITSVSCSKQNF